MPVLALSCDEKSRDELTDAEGKGERQKGQKLAWTPKKIRGI